MIATQLRPRGIRDKRVLRAMAEIPREQFVPAEARVQAYADEPIHIGYGQTISQPFMVALAAEELRLRGDESVLEVGAGCGYAAAVLGALAARVITVEIVPQLVDLARSNLRRTGCDRNVVVVQGDGSVGFSEGAPYDAISVAAAAPDIPNSLLDQLADRGRLVIPVGGRDEQEFRLIRKVDGRIESRIVTGCRFVPLRGGEGWD
jgi:protein-L-isoaspartate(D-aspartate) O-methyltransferase